MNCKAYQLSLTEFEKKLEFVRNNRSLTRVNNFDVRLRFSQSNAYIRVGEEKMELRYKVGTKVCSYISFKDGRDAVDLTSGADAYGILRRGAKFHVYGDEEEVVPNLKLKDMVKGDLSARPLLWCDERYQNQYLEHCVSYDVNSAYSWAMLQPMPDTSKPMKMWKKVQEGEIGFINDPLEKGLYMVEVGHYAQFVFPSVSSPFVGFVDRWYKRKKNAATKEDKARAKNVLNLCVGYLQLKNPFMRAAIVGYCNLRIEALIKKYPNNIIYANTDSITCRYPLNSGDIEVGNGLGEFKIEHEGVFKFIGFNCQWNNEIPKIRGAAKSRFKGTTYDLLTDELPPKQDYVEYLDGGYLKWLRKEEL